jgi:hypothetical protein
MASALAGIILNESLKVMMNKESSSYTLGYLESVLARVLDDAALNKVNDELIKGIESL